MDPVHHPRGIRFFFERDPDVLDFRETPKKMSLFYKNFISHIAINFDLSKYVSRCLLPHDDPREARGFVTRTDPRVSRKIGRVFWQFCPKNPADFFCKCEDNSVRYFPQWVRVSRREFRHRRKSSEEEGIDAWAQKFGWEAPERLATPVPVWNL